MVISLYRALACSRWAELRNSITFHGDLAFRLQAESEFRLLNGADPILIGHHSSAPDALDTLKARLADGPRGKTPLCRHVRQVVADIRKREQQLRNNHQRAVVVISTDGEASDGLLAEAMAPLQVMGEGGHVKCN